MAMNVTILSPERRLIERTETFELTLFGIEGEIQILPGHAPFIGSLLPGVFSFLDLQGKKVQGFISQGYFQVLGDEVVVTAETVELREEIDVDRASLAQKRAEEKLKEELPEDQFRRHQLKLQRALIRQQLASRS